jgi:hypothetical protein
MRWHPGTRKAPSRESRSCNSLVLYGESGCWWRWFCRRCCLGSWSWSLLLSGVVSAGQVVLSDAAGSYLLPHLPEARRMVRPPPRPALAGRRHHRPRQPHAPLRAAPPRIPTQRLGMSDGRRAALVGAPEMDRPGAETPTEHPNNQGHLTSRSAARTVTPKPQAPFRLPVGVPDRQFNAACPCRSPNPR